MCCINMLCKVFPNTVYFCLFLSSLLDNSSDSIVLLYLHFGSFHAAVVVLSRRRNFLVAVVLDATEPSLCPPQMMHLHLFLSVILQLLCTRQITPKVSVHRSTASWVQQLMSAAAALGFAQGWMANLEVQVFLVALEARVVPVFPLVLLAQ